ncbi:DUF3095 family protein [Bradyrhizobium sp. LM2.9]
MTADRSEAAFEVGLFQIKVDEEAEDDRFYEALVPFDFFDDVVRRDRYRPLPDDWIIAVTDVSQSTEAIEQGRYREVNTAGAAVLAAVSNALPDLQFFRPRSEEMARASPRPPPIRPSSRIRWQEPPLGLKTHWVSRCVLRSFLSRTFVLSSWTFW